MKKQPTLAQANAAYDRALKRNASTAVLVKLSNDIDAAAARAAKTQTITVEKNMRAVKIENDKREVKRVKDLAKARTAGLAVDTGTMTFSVGGEVIATVTVKPMLSVPSAGFDAFQAGVSREATRIVHQAMATFAQARVTNARSRAMGAAPSLREDLTMLKIHLRDSLAAAIKHGVAEVTA